MATLQLTVNGLNGNTRIISVSENSAIDDVFEEITKLELSSDIFIMHGTKQLHMRSGKWLKDYGIHNMSEVVVSQRQRGGWNPLEKIKTKKVELKALNGYITLTHEMDMITLDDDDSTFRAKMPCGHVIGPSGMTQYCQSLLSEKKYKFMCPDPNCEHEWPFFLVRHVACLSPGELQTIEKNLAENYAELGEGCKKCPGCGTWCFRIDANNKRVRCDCCVKNRAKTTDFCWSCTKGWVGGGVKECGNGGCDTRLNMLGTCKWKTIGNVQCPSVRACPKCNTLIEHVADCKHMKCVGCKRSFCFLCLGIANDQGRFSCGSYSAPCPVAPVQTKLN